MDRTQEDKLVDQFTKAFIKQDQNPTAAWFLTPVIKIWARSRVSDLATKPATTENVYELVCNIIFKENRVPMAGLVVEAWANRAHRTKDPKQQIASFMAIACMDITNDPKFSLEVGSAIEAANPQTAWDVICIRAHALGECLPTIV